MGGTEERLAELLHAAAPDTQPVALAEVALRVDRHRRRVRNAWGFAVGTAVAVIAVLAATVLPGRVLNQHGAPSPADQGVDLTGAVPWISTPARPYHAPKDRPAPRPAADAPPCTAGEVSARIAEYGDGASGHLWIPVTFRNVSTHTCVLAGYPTSVVATAPGHPPVTGTNGGYFPAPVPANMAPGGQSILGLQTASDCSAAPGGAGLQGPLYHQVAITLPGGGTLTVHRRAGLDLTCGLQLIKFGAARSEPQHQRRDPLTRLRARLDAPRQAIAGHVLVYVVTLTNPTNDAISLRRCPSYLQAAFDAGGVVKDARLLNCGPVDAIGAHRSVRFQMRLHLPGSLAVRDHPTRVRLTWGLELATLPASPASFTVVGPN